MAKQCYLSLIPPVVCDKTVLPGIHTPIFYEATALYSVPTPSAVYGTSMLPSAQRPPVYDTKILPSAYTACQLWQNNAPNCCHTFHSLWQNNGMYLALTSPVVYNAVFYSAPIHFSISGIKMLHSLHMDIPLCPCS